MQFSNKPMKVNIWTNCYARAITIIWHSLIILLIFGFFGCGPSNSKTIIKGTVTNCDRSGIAMRKICKSGLITIDSAEINRYGHFELAASIAEPTLISLNSNCLPMPILLLVDPNERIAVEVSDSRKLNYKVTGSRGSILLKELLYRHYATIFSIDSLAGVFKSSIQSENFDSVRASITEQYTKLIANNKNYIARFVRTNRYSLVSLVGLFTQYPNGQLVLNPQDDFELYKLVSTSLGQLYPLNDHIVSLKNKVEHIQKQNELRGLQNEMLKIGEKIDLKSIPYTNEIYTDRVSQARYILLDFWGSWCIPCISFRHSLIDLHSLYSPMGFEVVQFVFEKNWQKTLTDSIPWPLAWDTKLWDSEFIQQLEISTLPANYLIDRHGKIIEKNISAPQLKEALEKLIGPIHNP